MFLSKWKEPRLPFANASSEKTVFSRFPLQPTKEYTHAKQMEAVECVGHLAAKGPRHDLCPFGSNPTPGQSCISEWLTYPRVSVPDVAQ